MCLHCGIVAIVVSNRMRPKVRNLKTVNFCASLQRALQHGSNLISSIKDPTKKMIKIVKNIV